MLASLSTASPAAVRMSASVLVSSSGRTSTNRTRSSARQLETSSRAHRRGQQDRLVLQHADERLDELARRRIAPVRVFQHEQQRTPVRPVERRAGEHRLQHDAAALRGHLWRLQHSVDRDIERFGEHREVQRALRLARSREPLQLVQLRTDAVRGLELRHLDEASQQGGEWRVVEVLGALRAQHAPALCLDPLLEFQHQPRLADAGRAVYRRDGAMAEPRALPQCVQRLLLARAPLQRQQGPQPEWRVLEFGADDGPRRGRAAHVPQFEVFRPLEARATRQLDGRLVREHRVRFGDALQPRCEVARKADRRVEPLVLGLADDHRAGRDADPELHGAPAAGIALTDPLEDGQRAHGGEVGGAIGGYGVSEVGLDAVPGVARDMTAIVGDNLPHGAEVLAHEAPQQVRVAVRRDLGRPDDVAIEDRDLSPAKGIEQRWRSALDAVSCVIRNGGHPRRLPCGLGTSRQSV